MTDEKQPPAPMTLPHNRMGAEYNLEHGLDWDRIRSEHRARLTPRQIVRGDAMAKGIQKGMPLAEAKAQADVAEAMAFPVPEAEGGAA